MPKTNATNKKLRAVESQLQEIQRQMQPQREPSRVPVPRRNVWDWICKCGYCVYEGKDRCPKCDRKRADGTMCYGFRRRQPCGPAAAAPTRQPSYHVQQVPRVAPRSYLDVARANAIQQQPQQQQQQQQPPFQQPQPMVQQPPQQQQRNQPSNSNTVLAVGQQPQPQRGYNAVNPAEEQGLRAQALAKATGSNLPSAATAAPGKFAERLPVGPVAKPPTQFSDSVAEQRVLRKDIFSADDEAAMAAEDAGLDDITIHELDESVTDPNKVFTRIAGIKKAIVRKSKKLERAKEDLCKQQLVVDEAQAELEVRAGAVSEVEADLQRYKELQSDLSMRHAALTAAAAQQQREEETKLQTLNAAQRAQQVLWDTAASLRGLGVDPRIDQAIAALGSLFQEAAQDAAALSQPTPPAPVSRSDEVQGVPAQKQAHAAPPPAPTLQPPANPGVTAGPTAASVAQIICAQCWSVSCRCRPPAATGAPCPAEGMEVDQERGKKRSCKEATLPERAANGQQSPGALLVDACGAPANPGSAAEAEEEKQPSTNADEPSGAAADRGVEEPAAEQQEPESMAVEAARQPANSTPAAESTVGEKASSADASGVPESYAKAEKVADEAAKEESRSSFSSLVKAACSQRSYPY